VGQFEKYMEKETQDSLFSRHTRHYIAKSLITLDLLEAALRYPTEFSDPLEAVADLKLWNLEALKAASGSMHTIPVSK
jgi:hypothetical protein